LICFEKKSTKKERQGVSARERKRMSEPLEGYTSPLGFVRREKKKSPRRVRRAKGTPPLSRQTHTFQKKTTRRGRENAVPDAINGFNFGAHMACAYEVPSLFMQK